MIYAIIFLITIGIISNFLTVWKYADESAFALFIGSIVFLLFVVCLPFAFPLIILVEKIRVKK